jgi:hypothetical protein
MTAGTRAGDHPYELTMRIHLTSAFEISPDAAFGVAGVEVPKNITMASSGALVRPWARDASGYAVSSANRVPRFKSRKSLSSTDPATPRPPQPAPVSLYNVLPLDLSRLASLTMIQRMERRESEPGTKAKGASPQTEPGQ